MIKSTHEISPSGRLRLGFVAGSLEPLALITRSGLCIVQVDAGGHPCLMPRVVTPLAAARAEAGGNSLVSARVRGGEGNRANASHCLIFVSKFQ